MRDHLVAIDGGGTKTLCVVYDRSGEVLAAETGGPSNHLSADPSRVFENLRDTVTAALQSCDVALDDVALVSAGFAGVDSNGRGGAAMEEILKRVGFPACLVNGDMVIAHVGALDGRPGVVAVSGTGSVFFGRSPSGKYLKCGGFGRLFGDEGSGHWIARTGLNAASRAYDGRGPQTSLVSAFCAAMKVDDFSAIPEALVLGEFPRDPMSWLSQTVADTAMDGDAVARGILEQAGDELAQGVESVVRRLGMVERCEVSYQGAVLRRCAPVRRSFEEALKKRMPGAALTRPAGDPIDGARILGFQILHWESSNAVDSISH